MHDGHKAMTIAPWPLANGAKNKHFLTLYHSIYEELHKMVWEKEKMLVNPVTNDKILDWSKLKAFAHNKINVTEKLKFVLGRVKNIVGKGENASFSFSHNVFKRLLMQDH